MPMGTATPAPSRRRHARLSTPPTLVRAERPSPAPTRRRRACSTLRRSPSLSALLLLFAAPSYCCAYASSSATAVVIDDYSHQTCPPHTTQYDYLTFLSTCTARCNSRGYCCTTSLGGCENVPCTVGCHIAYFAHNVTECKSECAVANDSPGCTYTHHRHSDVGHLDGGLWHPTWSEGRFVHGPNVHGSHKCVTPDECGCPHSDYWGDADDCSEGACGAGCDVAAEIAAEIVTTRPPADGIAFDNDETMADYFTSTAPAAAQGHPFRGPTVPIIDAANPADYVQARQNCTDACNDSGYCCTLNVGGCNTVPCTTGCHIAYFASNVDDCKAECDAANDVEQNWCTYEHERHSDVGHLGFDVNWMETSGGGWAQGMQGMHKCGVKDECGCASGDHPGRPGPWGTANDCTPEACRAGCDLANDPQRRHLFFRGPEVMIVPDHGGDMMESILALRQHIDETQLLTEEQIDENVAIFTSNAALLELSLPIIEHALDLIDAYESVRGPLFLNDETRGGFSRRPSSYGNQRAGRLERAMLTVQQTVLDRAYHGSVDNFPTYDRLLDPMVRPCRSVLEGRYWQTSRYFPGFVEPPPDEGVVHVVDLNATMPPCWGRPVTFCTEPSVRPTGLYLSPGRIATVTVPQSMLDAGDKFKIQVGANTVNHQNKGWVKRMDRITTTFDVKTRVTHVANPLGGGLYIWVPHESNLGLVSVNVTGGVVRSPIFSRVPGVRMTTEAGWDELRTAPGPWADLETDKFMLQVPRNWIYDYSYAHVEQLLINYDKAMDGISELCGYPPYRRNNYVLYLGVDTDSRALSYGIGYPQVNVAIHADANGPQPVGPPGRSNHWTVTNPTGFPITYHEVGHQQIQTRYRESEEEAAVNLLYVYVENVKFGVDLDVAFNYSYGHDNNFTIDGSAINWMITSNFREGNEMDYSNTEYDQFRYQHRGYAKYADIARLFGWQVIRLFYYQENLDHEAGRPGAGANLSAVDSRTLRLSIAAGVDLIPLIHFWGIHPVNEAALRAEIDNHNLPPSSIIRDQIARYATIVPMNQTEFIAHFQEVWPGKKDQTYGCPSPIYGCGWYNEWHQKWNEGLAQATVDAVQHILDKYYPPLLPSEPRQVRSCSNGRCDGNGRKVVGNNQKGLDLKRSRSGSRAGSRPGSRRGSPPRFDRLKFQRDLDVARDRWNSLSRRDYDCEYEVDFFGPDDCKGPYICEVRSGSLATVVDNRSGNAVSEECAVFLGIHPSGGDFMEAFFDAMRDESNGNAASYMNAKADSQTGIPDYVFEARVGEIDGDRGATWHFVRNCVAVEKAKGRKRKRKKKMNLQSHK